MSAGRQADAERDVICADLCPCLREREIWRKASVLKTGENCYLFLSHCYYLLSLAGTNRGGKLAVF